MSFLSEGHSQIPTAFNTRQIEERGVWTLTKIFIYCCNDSSFCLILPS